MAMWASRGGEWIKVVVAGDGYFYPVDRLKYGESRIYTKVYERIPPSELIPKAKFSVGYPVIVRPSESEGTFKGVVTSVKFVIACENDLSKGFLEYEVMSNEDSSKIWICAEDDVGYPF